MRLNELGPAPGSKKARKRLGRGTGSGYGKTAGRGQKGALSRSGAKAHMTHEGGQMPLQRRLPRLKGMARGPHTPARPKVYAPINVGELAELSGSRSSRRRAWSARKRTWSRSWATGRSGVP